MSDVPLKEETKSKQEDVNFRAIHHSQSKHFEVKDKEKAVAPAPTNTEAVVEPEAKETKESGGFQFTRRSSITVASQGEDNTEVFCSIYSPDSRFLAAGCGDGSIRIFNSVGRIAYNLNVGKPNKLPVTCLRFRPAPGNAQVKNVLLAANADGTVAHWHVATQRCVFSIEEKDNQVYALDYAPDGDAFVTAGRDCKLRLYEEATKTLLRTFTAGKTGKTAGHSNRIYSVKFKPDEPNILLSGGWDNTIQFWDVRTGQSFRSIYGPHICGDALDINRDGHILTGSWRPSDALQLWDFATGKLMQNIAWTRDADVKQPQYLYAASFSPEADLIAAGGSGTNEGKVFDVKKGYKLCDRVFMGDKGVYSLSFAPNGRKLCFAGGAKDICVVDLK